MSQTLWLGNVDGSIDEGYLRTIFMGEPGINNVKLIKDKNTGQPLGYGFLEFSSTHAAQACLEKFQSRQIQGAVPSWRLNWAQQGGGTGGGSGGAPRPGEFSLYISDIDPDMTELQLSQVFRMSYPSCTGVKIVSERAKGYGFVRFQSEKDAARCLLEMQGAVIGCRAIKLSQAAGSRAPSLVLEEDNKAAAAKAAAATSPGYPAGYDAYMAGYYQNMAMYQKPVEPEIDQNYFVKPYDVQAANFDFVSKQNARVEMEQWAASRTQFGIPIVSITPYICSSSQL